MGNVERTPLVVGNWKMELSYKGELELARALKRQLLEMRLGVEVVVCPSYPSLAGVNGVFGKEGAVAVGAQSVSVRERGAQTGEVSVLQIAPFVRWCIVGHSEARAARGLSDDDVQQTVALLLAHGILPIVCLGESGEERAADATIQRLTAQMTIILNKLTRTLLSKVVIVYEPIWAISANDPETLPDPADVAGTMLLMRKLAAERFGGEAADRLRMLYGGSVSPDNAGEFAREPGIDGLLVGSASLHPRRFVDIVRAVNDAR
jgi:triosephosphate isomerase